MQLLHIDEDVLTWPCPDIGLHRVSEKSRMDLVPHWPEQVQCALDRIYRRRRVPIVADRHPIQHMNLKLHCGPARTSRAHPQASDIIDIDAALPKEPFPHV